MIKQAQLILLSLCFASTASAQTLSLEECRAMALDNNKQLSIGQLKKDMTAYARKAARTKYLPKVDAIGGYEFFSKEVSILNNNQKATLGSLGTNAMNHIGSNVGDVLTDLAMKGVISPQTAHDMGTLIGQVGAPIAQAGDNLGQSIADAFRTDTRNIWEGAVMVRQPIYMGGAITAMNKMANLAEDLTKEEMRSTRSNTLYKIDETYWLIVSLAQKKRLAESYLDLVSKLDSDVHKMIDEGIATKADGLKVDVKMNEAEMAVMQVDNGLALSKMLLCQLCGMPAEQEITLADEDNTEVPLLDMIAFSNENIDYSDRPELKMLETGIGMSEQATKLMRAAYLPQVAVIGGYMFSNPNVFNGFEKKFSGVWNVGVAVRVPVWNWMEGVYKVKAGKTATTIARMEMQEAEEMINLQVTQCRYKVEEAHKRMNIAIRNLGNATENLRCANVGFREGMMGTTEVMAAQTAWQSAQIMKIDAEIDYRLAVLAFEKALGK